MRDGLEDLQAGRGRLARLPFEVVRDVAEEFEAVFGGPEEGVGQDRCGVGAGGFVSVGTCWMGWMGVVFLPVTWVLGEHLADEVICLVSVIA